MRFHRDGDQEARAKLESILRSLTPMQSVQIVRAYSYFSHLSNLAEDQNLIRKMRRDAIANVPRSPARWHALSPAPMRPALPPRNCRISSITLS
ncbi:MAG: phosphoenolpyruvate carboxylase [Methylovirgula sp.]